MNYTVETTKRERPGEERSAVLRGRMVSITALEVYTPDLEEVERQLREKSRQAPSFFRGAPLLLDLSKLRGGVDLAWLGRAYALIVQNDFMALGVAGADPGLEEEVRKSGIPLWPSMARKEGGAVQEDDAEHLGAVAAGTGEPPDKPPQPHPEPEPERRAERPGGAQEDTQGEAAGGGAAPPSSSPPSSTRVVSTPVRSGQRYYARGGDLIVLASVNTGAEIMADGHIHVYGSLRGRALAGVNGQEDARIFCHDLQADLVAIAGYYLINEDLPANRRGKAVQISLHRETLHIDPL